MPDTNQPSSTWINIRQEARTLQPTPRLLWLLLLPIVCLALAEFWPVMGILAAALLLGTGLLLLLDWQRTPRAGSFQLERQHHLKLGIHTANPIDIVIHNHAPILINVRIRDEVPVEFQQRSLDQILTAAVNAHSSHRLTYDVKPTRRGEYHFGNLNLRWESVWGLFGRQAVYDAATKARVYPNLLKIHQYEQLARKGQQVFSGLRLLRHTGEGGEFEQLRDYLPDDDYRRIYWKATAKYGKPITIDYSPERSQNIIMLIDTGQQMLTRPLGAARTTRLDLIINAVLLFSYIAVSRGDRFGLMTFDQKVHRYLPPRSGMGQFYFVVESLYDVEARPVDPDYGRALQYLHAQRQNRSLIVLLTDPTSQEAAQGLVGQLGAFYPRHLPMCVTLSDPVVLDTARRAPYNIEAIYQRAMAEQVLDERQLWLNQLQQQGVMTLDVPAYQLSPSLINKYLEMKDKFRI